MRLIVVGNGMAGSRLVSEVRARDPHMKITVFGAETCQPYNRVLLSNVLAGSSRPEQVRLLDPSWYEAHNVEAAFGSAVAHIDRDTGHVVTSDGRREPYDLLVLATGSDAIVPPIPGVERAIPFRTLEDCERIMESAEHAGRAVVIGGGLLGIEAARGLAGRGLPVTLLHLAGHLMERQLDVEAGEVLGETLAGLGVETRTGVAASGVEEHGVRLDDGELVRGDLVILACGVRPVTGLAAEAGLEVRRGVVVDDELRTDDPSIFAIGECAEHEGMVYGLVAPAWEQAAVAADVITGGKALYRGSRLVTRLKAKSVELAAMGETQLGEEHAEVVRFSHRARGTYRKLVIRDGRLVGAILLGESDAVGTLTQLFDRGGPVPGDRAGLLFPGLASAPVAESPTLIPDAAKICQCNNVTKGQIRACWEAGARDVAGVAAATRATTGCGTCRDAVEGIVGWLCEQEGVPA
ncbi:FAD-dependent oxidoreductase [Nonomuraea sp. NPDC050404]|uniref:FAD-dependent oxidoreductase n=1 Tax=Nonomuraea sp. NPDC050404 TaxID=3155783 RepID=UPI0033C2D174